MTFRKRKRKIEKEIEKRSPIEKEVMKLDKDGNESVVTIFYKIKCIESTGFINPC